MLKHLLGSRGKSDMAPHNSKTIPVDASESTGDETGAVTTSSTPVDMDQYCDDASSNASVAPPTIEEEDAFPVVSTTPEESSLSSAKLISHSRTSALTRAMALRQSSITKTFTGMISVQLKVAQANKSVSQAKLDQYKEQAEATVKKQERMTKQFEALVHRLEQEAQEKETANRNLKRSLQLTHKMLKAEGLMNDAGIEESMLSCVKSATSGKQRRNNKKTSTTPHRSNKEREIFSITEIFCPKETDEIDDMTCHFLNDPACASSTPPTTPSSSGSKTLRMDDDEDEIILDSEFELLEV